MQGGLRKLLSGSYPARIPYHERLDVVHHFHRFNGTVALTETYWASASVITWPVSFYLAIHLVVLLGLAGYRIYRMTKGQGFFPRPRPDVPRSQRTLVFALILLGTALVFAGSVMLWYTAGSVPKHMGSSGFLGAVDSFDQDMQSLEGQVQSTTTYVSQELRTGSKATYSSMQQASNLTAAASAYVKASEAVRSEVETTRRDVAYALGVFAKAMAALSASMAFVAIVVGFLSYLESRTCVVFGAIIAFPCLVVSGGMCACGLVIWTFWEDLCFEVGRFQSTYDAHGPDAACAMPITQLFPCPSSAARWDFYQTGMVATNTLIYEGDEILYDYDQGTGPVTGRYGFLCPRFNLTCDPVLDPSVSKSRASTSLSEQCRFCNMQYSDLCSTTCQDIPPSDPNGGTPWVEGTTLDQWHIFDKLECTPSDAADPNNTFQCRAAPGLAAGSNGYYDPSKGPRGKIADPVYNEFAAKIVWAQNMTVLLGPDYAGRAVRVSPLSDFFKTMSDTQCGEVDTDLWLYWTGFAVVAIGTEILCVGYILGLSRIRKAVVFEEEKCPEMRVIYGDSKVRRALPSPDSDDDV